MTSPRLPWEVIERVIDRSGDDPKSLCSLSLTCRQLHPRSRRLLFTRLDFKSRDRVFAFVDFIQDNPHLKRSVRSIVVRPADFAPWPLLHILPNLSEVGFTSRECFAARPDAVSASWHQSSLTCSQRFGSHVQTLHLFCLSFATYLSFARALLAFASIAHLTCTHVVIHKAGDRGPLDVITRRLSAQMQLKTLTIDHLSLIKDSKDASVGELLFHSDLAPSTVETLTLMREHRPDTISCPSDWLRLRSLVLQLSSYMPEVVTKATTLLGNLCGCSVLKEVTLEFGPVSSILGAIRDFSRNSQSHPDAYKELERALLKYPRPGIIWTMGCRLRVGRNSFWAGELGRQFPSVSRRGALVLKSELSTPAGHDATLQALVVSPHSQWVASGSEDLTVVVWDANGNIAQQWLNGAHESVWSLAFSPDGRYLVCGDGAGKMEIRDLNPTRSPADATLPEVITLDGHCGAPVSSCAWSPNGDVIASGSFDGTVRLWDAHTFQQRHLLEQRAMKGMQYVAFSPNGRWLASWCFPCNYCIWDVASGTLHKFIPPDEWHGTSALRMLDIVAAFDPASTRLATVARNDTVGLWDVETGRRDRVLRRVGEANDVSFSPDGKWLLTASSDRTVRVWDAHEGAEVRRLRGHASIVSKACFSPCGRYIASASWDETVRVWRAGDGSCMAVLSEHEHLVTHVAFSPDGKTLVSGARNGTVVIRDMHDIIPMAEHDE